LDRGISTSRDIYCRLGLQGQKNNQEILKGGNAMPKAGKDETPLMAFEENASAPILRYDIPSPSMFEGRNYIELDIPEDWFEGKETKDKAYDIPKLQKFFDANVKEIREYLTAISKDDLERQLCEFGVDKIDNPPNVSKYATKAELSEKAISAAQNIDPQIGVLAPNLLESLKV
jgi:hypothetical protein